MKFIYSILLALLWVGITITLGSYLYRMGLPVVNASAQKLLLRTIDEDLEYRFRKLNPNHAYATGKKQTKHKKVTLTDKSGTCNVCQFAIDTVYANTSFIQKAKQSFLIERNPIHVDSLNQKWQLKLRMDGIRAKTGIKLINSLKDGERISVSSGLNEPDCFLLAYSTGVGYCIKMDAFIRPFWVDVILKAHWNNIRTWSYVLFSLIFCLFYIPSVRLFLVRILSGSRIEDNHVESSQPLAQQKGEFVWEVNGLTFDYLQRSITYHDQTCILRKQVAEVLLAFLKAPGHLLLNEDLKKLFWKELDNVDSFMERRNRLITDLRTDLRIIGANLSVTLVNGGYQLHFSLENSKKSVKNQ